MSTTRVLDYENKKREIASALSGIPAANATPTRGPLERAFDCPPTNPLGAHAFNNGDGVAGLYVTLTGYRISNKDALRLLAKGVDRYWKEIAEVARDEAAKELEEARVAAVREVEAQRKALDEKVAALAGEAPKLGAQVPAC